METQSGCETGWIGLVFLVNKKKICSVWLQLKHAPYHPGNTTVMMSSFPIFLDFFLSKFLKKTALV